MEYVIPIVIIALLIGIPVVIMTIRRKKATRCKQCKKKLNYDEEVSWSVVSQYYSEKGDKLFADVEITYLCSNCGFSKTFKRSFTVAQIDHNGNARNYDLDNLVRKYFK